MSYENTSQMAKLCKKDYEFNLPIFGKSTTDPTYYEPSATRIANMRKSSSAGKSLYDYTAEEFNKLGISNSRVVPGRKPGLTQEEISQYYQDTKSDLINNLEENNEIKALEDKNKQNVIDTIKEITSDEE